MIDLNESFDIINRFEIKYMLNLINQIIFSNISSNIKKS